MRSADPGLYDAWGRSIDSGSVNQKGGEIPRRWQIPRTVPRLSVAWRGTGAWAPVAEFTQISWFRRGAEGSSPEPRRSDTLNNCHPEVSATKPAAAGPGARERDLELLPARSRDACLRPRYSLNKGRGSATGLECRARPQLEFLLDN